MSRRFTLVLTLGLLVVALLGATSARAESIRGSATYRERMMLPPDAVFEATILDVSRADGPAEVIGRVVVDPAGQVPRPSEEYCRAHPSQRGWRDHAGLFLHVRAVKPA